MQKVETPMLAPAQCKLCGGASKEWYLDTEIQEEFYGRIYYCNECIAFIVTICGFMGPQEKASYERALAERDQEIYELATKLDAYRSIQDGLNRLGFADLGGSHAPAVDLGLSDVPRHPSTPGTDASSPESELGDGTRETAESTDDGEMDGLRSDRISEGSDFGGTI